MVIGDVVHHLDANKQSYIVREGCGKYLVFGTIPDNIDISSDIWIDILTITIALGRRIVIQHLTIIYVMIRFDTTVFGTSA